MQTKRSRIVLRAAVMLAVVLAIAGVAALTPRGRAAAQVYDLCVEVPDPVAWGSSFEILWNTVPNATDYAVTVTHAGGTLHYTGAGSVTVDSNDFAGSPVSFSVCAYWGDYECCVSGPISMYTAGTIPDGPGTERYCVTCDPFRGTPPAPVPAVAGAPAPEVVKVPLALLPKTGAPPSPAGLVGIVVGTVVAAGMIAGGVVLLRRRKD
jgi:hypothetical protein